jgi:hypothetical protein
MNTSMTSVVGRVLGITALLATSVACDDGGTDDGTGGTGAMAVGGTPGSGGTPGTSGTGTGGMGTPAVGVPLIPTDGWVDGASNTIMVQGAMFAYADATSGMGMVEDFTGTNACIKGTAALVDMACTPVAPATDCYGTYWGAAIGLNLNQPIDPATMMGADPMKYDASALKGFGFEVSGMTVPLTLRFKVEDASGEFCTPSTKPIMVGANTVLFSELVKECWEPMAATMNPNAEAAKSGLLKIAWQVVTKDTATVPFDYCISNVVALQ